MEKGSCQAKQEICSLLEISLTTALLSLPKNMPSYWQLFPLHRIELRTKAKRLKMLSSDKLYNVSLSCLRALTYTTRNIHPKGKNI